MTDTETVPEENAATSASDAGRPREGQREKARRRIVEVLAVALWRGCTTWEVGNRLPGRQKCYVLPILRELVIEGLVTEHPFVNRVGRPGTRWLLVDLPTEEPEPPRCPHCWSVLAAD